MATMSRCNRFAVAVSQHPCWSAATQDRLFCWLTLTVISDWRRSGANVSEPHLETPPQLADFRAEKMLAYHHGPFETALSLIRFNSHVTMLQVSVIASAGQIVYLVLDRSKSKLSKRLEKPKAVFERYWATSRHIRREILAECRLAGVGSRGMDAAFALHTLPHDRSAARNR